MGIDSCGSNCKDLSHWVIGTGGDAQAVVGDTPPSQGTSQGKDPTTGVSGFKYDSGQQAGTTQQYSVTFEGEIAAKEVRYSVKGSTYYGVGRITGPDFGQSVTRGVPSRNRRAAGPVTEEFDRTYSVFVDMQFSDGTWEYGINVPFNSKNQEWSDMELPVRPSKTIQNIYIHTLYQEHAGTVCFDNFEVSDSSGNLVQNPGFEELLKADDSPRYWEREDGSGATVSNSNPQTDSDNYELCLGTTQGQELVYQILKFINPSSENQATTLLIGGTVLTSEDAIAPDEPHNFGVYADIRYTDGSWNYGQYAALTLHSTTPGLTVTKIIDIPAGKVVEYLQIAAVFRNAGGVACFSDIFASWGDIVTEGTAIAITHGGPHLETFDGLFYDFHALGEYTLVKSAQKGLTINVRHAQAGEAAVTSAMGVSFAGATVSVVRAEKKNSKHAELYVNDRRVTLGDGGVGNVKVYNKQNKVQGVVIVSGEANKATGARARVSIRLGDGGTYGADVLVGLSASGVQFLDVFARIPQSVEDLEGLLGNRDGKTKNDLLNVDGAQLGNNPSHSDIYGEGGLADKWRVADDDKIIYKKSGETADSFHDPTFYSTKPSYSSGEKSAASEACAGLEGQLNHNCVDDYLASNGDFGTTQLRVVGEITGTTKKKSIANIDSAGSSITINSLLFLSIICLLSLFF